MVALAIFWLAGATAYGQPQSSDVQTAVAAMDAAIVSLQQKPNQFSVQETCIGLQATSTGSGTGLSVNTIGGGAGSQTTGLRMQLSDAQCNIVANNAVNQSSEQAIELLKEIKSALQVPKIDEPNLLSKLSTFAQLYIAPVLPAVLEAVIKKALHLG